MKRQNVLNCSFSSWYPLFKEHTVRSRILPLPDSVIEYLNADGIVLPESSHGINSREGTEWDSDDEDLNDVWSADQAVPSKAPSFPEFDEEIRKAIKALGGKVFPKLNWSSPKDASWITLNHTLECRTPADVYLLLKSSTFVAHDLTNPFEVCDVMESGGTADAKLVYELVLRRWHELNPAGEFRCFVKNHNLIGVCQRQTCQYFEHIASEEKRILQDIVRFLKDVVRGKFPDSDYVLDLYRNNEEKLYILDFNPFCSVTDGLMFSWDELERMDSESRDNSLTAAPEKVGPLKVPEFRFVKTDTGLQGNPYQKYAMPQDFIDLTTGSDPNKLVDFLQLKIQQQGSDSSDDDEEEKEETPAVVNTITRDLSTGDKLNSGDLDKDKEKQNLVDC